MNYHGLLSQLIKFVIDQVFVEFPFMCLATAFLFPIWKFIIVPIFSIQLSIGFLDMALMLFSVSLLKTIFLK
jgi:hypothetical protein